MLRIKSIKMNLLNTGIAVILASSLLVGCTKNFDKVNTDSNSLSSVGSNEFPYMFSYALQAPTLSPDNFEIGEGTIASVYSQFFSQAAHSFPTDRYVVVQPWMPACWNPVYISAAPQLKTIMANTDVNSAENALANVWWVWMFHRVTDYFGPIPYFEAASGKTSIAYTPQDSVYYDFFKRLSSAVTVLKSHTGEKPFGTYDLVYGKKSDPVSAWIKFANTLRLRLALRISKVNPTLAKSEAEAAVAAGTMDTNGDDAYMPKNKVFYNEFNGLAVTAGWDDIRMSAAMESILKGYNDPRLAIYFQPAVATGEYAGVRNGLYTSEKIIDANSRLFNSNLGTRWTYWDQNISDWKTNYDVPFDLMHPAEAYFLKAEGALNGWNMGGTAQAFYEQGIRVSMAQWGITDGTAISNYVASTATPVAPNDYFNSPAVNNYPIKWSADANMNRKQVAQQKWLALFPDGMEGWAEVRRSGFPELYHIIHSDNTDITPDKFIRRMPFLTTEAQTNTAAVQKAVSLLGGPDNVLTPLWWDKN
ncbi:MAG: SusD/RagB family nutrient-binding outer membrane lipoprotein [Chitinophagaceae bacterium]|uniref:SusD/RagB family nutrient-binding outer membrane lipoprotein n=1 Tax=unclassified Paraflavitalea TaxID=2798305 RepID=UPI003D347911|nr:SusD/RagB family nutrient-binding outer membrane lipoprotein [Chitinophagaceae bacterium]